MSKYFIRYDKENYEVQYIHYKPFDNYYGLKKTEDDLLKEGAIITSLPKEPIVPEGKTLKQLYNPKTNELYYEFVDINKEELPIENQYLYEIKSLKDENEKIRQELALTQDAVNELLFSVINM